MTETIAAFIVAGMAVWRISTFLGGERGPFALGAWIRSWFGIDATDEGGISYDEFGEVRMSPPTGVLWWNKFLYEVAAMILCIRCCSVWVAIVIALFIPPIVNYVFTVAALSAFAILYNSFVER